MIMGATDCEGNTQTDLRKMDTAIKLNLRNTSLNEALAAIPQNLKPVIEKITDKGASSWLNALPLKNQDFDLNKEDFRDAPRLRYGISLEYLPSMCACGERFNVNHALSCKKGGLVTNRHGNLRDVLRYCYTRFAIMFKMNHICYL